MFLLDTSQDFLLGKQCVNTTGRALVALDSVFQFLFFRHEQRKDLFTDFENAIKGGYYFGSFFGKKKLFLKMVASLPGTKEPFMRRETTSRSGRRPDKASLLLIFVVN